ncbi:hypothetical protein ACV0BM_006035 [Elizabethkingia meningoseptica]
MKYYYVKSINLPFSKEWNIYNNWVSSDRNLLIEKIRQDLEAEVLFEKTTLTENDGWLLVNNSTDKWLMICELELLS